MVRPTGAMCERGDVWSALSSPFGRHQALSFFDLAANGSRILQSGTT
jgi:hypothetical protein